MLYLQSNLIGIVTDIAAPAHNSLYQRIHKAALYAYHLSFPEKIFCDDAQSAITEIMKQGGCKLIIGSGIAGIHNYLRKFTP